VVLNEFLSPPWGRLGIAALESLEFFTDPFWIWAGAGYLVFYFLVLTLASVWGLERCRLPPKRPQVRAWQRGTCQGKRLLTLGVEMHCMLQAHARPSGPECAFAGPKLNLALCCFRLHLLLGCPCRSAARQLSFGTHQQALPAASPTAGPC
jgi:hypothetical protein